MTEAHHEPIPALAAHRPSQLVLLLAVGALLPGLCEEALFRGAIQGVCCGGAGRRGRF